MSLRFRTISNKFTSLVNTRKQITKIDRQLPKNVTSSSFLDEFFGLQTSVDTKANLREKNVDVLIDTYPFRQNLPISVKLHWKWKRTLAERYARNEDEVSHRERQSLMNHSRFMNTEPMLITNLLLYDIAMDHKERKNKSVRKDAYIASRDTDLFINNNRCFSNQKMSGATADNNFEQNTILLTNGKINVQEVSNKQSIQGSESRPSKEQLENVFQNLSHDLPNFFTKHLNYNVYSQDIIFINNIKGSTSQGLLAYIKKVAFVKTIAHLKYAYVILQVLKITTDPSTDTIKVRWRIRGITGFRVFFMLWKFKLWNMKESLQEAEIWYDGFSTYYVDANGKIYKHVVDKWIPDQHEFEQKPPVVTKLAMFAGLEDSQILYTNEFIKKLKHRIMPDVKSREN